MEHALITPPSRTSNAPHQIRILNALSVETLLLARCFVRSQDLPAYGIPLPEANRRDRLNRVKSLLKAGADPNIIVGIYKGDDRLTVERLEPNADKVEWLDGTSHDNPSYIVRSWTQSVARGLTRQCSPIVESITDWDHALTALLVRHGARLNEIVYYLYDGFMTERTRYLDSGEQRFIERLLKLQDSVARPLQRWITSTLEEHLLGQASFFCAYLLTTEEQIARLKWVRREPLELPEEAIQCIERNPTLLTILSHGVPEILVAAVVDDLRLLPIALRNGSQVSAADSRGLTALHIAVGSVTTAFCQRLIELGADPDTQDSIGVTPLMEAVYYGNDAAAQLLLSVGADPSPGYQSAIRKLMTAKSNETALRLLTNGSPKLKAT